MIEAALASILLLVPPDPCSLPACSCSMSPIIEEGVSQDHVTSAAIFVGRVIHITDTVVARPRPRGQGQDHYRFDEVILSVQQGWKGPQVDTLRIHPGLGLCAFAFELGREYVVFAHVENQRAPGISYLSTSTCSYTRELSRADSVLAVLGPRAWQRP
jgi:hypothetical protein